MSTHAIAVDVGGTEIKAAVVELRPGSAHALRQIHRRTPSGGDPASAADAVVSVVAEVITDLHQDAEAVVDSVGVVVPGIVDERRGVGVFSADPAWRDEPLRDKIAAHTDLPVTLGHDARAGGLAEARLGAARGIRDVAVLPVGTGIAAALVLDGRLHTADGHAGEIGHLDVGHGEPCACGSSGCLEAIASCAAMARRYQQRIGRPVRGSAEVAAAVRAGDPDARKVWDEAVDGLASGILALSMLVAPEVVVLGGGLAASGRLFLEPLRHAVNERGPGFHRRPRIELAELGEAAGCLGAALLATGEGE